jgi:hypothetical protein
VEILAAKRRRYIQTCGRNEEGYVRAWDKLSKTVTDWRKKRTEDSKIQIERWKMNKSSVDEARAHVSDRCLTILVLPRLLRTKLARPPSAKPPHLSANQRKDSNRLSCKTKTRSASTTIVKRTT